MTTDDCAPLEAGHIRFYDNYVPRLEVGNYLINVTQRINPQNTAIDECYAASQVFSVEGPRYTLPADDLFSVFPPANARGVFDQFLPHAVLTRRDLPWERNIFNTDPAQRTPWMALLLFVDGEQIDGKPALLPPQVDGWQSNQTMTASIPASSFYHHGAGDGILWPQMEREWYETDDYLQSTMCSIVDLSPAAFARLVPSRDDLPYLAHARRVDPTAKDGDVLRVSGDGWYSVLVGNRLPGAPPAGTGQPGTRNVVHLVSLEGLEAYVSGAKSGATQLPAGTTRVRMISFKSWSFTCLPELGESFSQLMTGLLKDRQGNEKGTAFALSVPPPPDGDAAPQDAYRAIQLGYVPLSYQTRLGEQTFAWYRGPFSPVPVKNFISSTQQSPDGPAGREPFDTASSAMIYDKRYGMFDVSYAVAWEIGRLLALSNAYLGQELLDWAREGHHRVDLILERRSQIAALQNMDRITPVLQAETDLLDQIKPHAVTGGFMTYLLTQFTEEIAPRLYDQVHAPPDQPLVPYPDLPSPPPTPQSVADLLRETDVQRAIREAGGQELDRIADQLAHLYLLTGVPFENLVPNAGLLPPESVRFFYLDSNWLDALIQGALSIGIESSRDRLYHGLMKDRIWDATLAAVQRVRDTLLGSLAHTTPPGGKTPFDQGAMAGMLLRSAVVSGWPGLGANAYLRTQPSSPNPDPASHIGLLRMERLSGDVLLCLWPAVPAVVTVDEPHEGVAFGFEDPPGGSEGYYLYLRSLDQKSYGVPLPEKQYGIDATKGIIDSYRRIAIGGSGGLRQTIQGKLPGNPELKVRDFAVQMIKTPEQAVFAARPPSGG
ncbi:MAG: hypothetical protein JOZ41_08925 [Chloroflexi bacterium]|nr:hypothetical protein [Chloroflexota bacterium]